MGTLSEIITELNQNYNALGEDLVLLEALIGAVQGETVFPEDCVETAVYRMGDYIEQHAGEIVQTAESASHCVLSRDCPFEPGGSNGRPAPGMERQKVGARSRGRAALPLHGRP